MTDGKTGKELGVELNKLWYAGKVSLPAAAKDYLEARNNISSSSNGAQHAFYRPAQFGGECGAYGAWEGLREEFERILHETLTSLDLTGNALCLCASAYANADQAAKAEFERLRREDIGH